MGLRIKITSFLALLLLGGLPQSLLAADEAAGRLDFTGHWVGLASIAIFAVAYLLVMAEEFTHLRKSKPVIIAAGLIWGLIG